MRVVFAGTPEVAVPSLQALINSGHEVVGVVTRPDAPSGRGRRLTPSPVAIAAEPLDVPILKPSHPRDSDFQVALRALRPDAIPVVAYGALVPAALLDLTWVNLHFSVLPAWRGAAPVQHAIWAGDEVTGATTFRLVAELDAGPVYDVLQEPIATTDTAGDLLGRLAVSGAALLVRTLDALEAGTAHPVEQPAHGVSFAPKITTDDAFIDWTASAIEIDRQIRACSPAPGAWSTYSGQRIKVGPVSIDPTLRLAPGELAVGKNSVCVGTGDDVVRLGEVKAFGKRQMAAADWARGERPAPGASLGEA